MAPTVKPRIYVACLAAYNQGMLHGRWIDADQDAEAIGKAADLVIATSPADGPEETAIHDYEGFGATRLGESSPWCYVAALGQAISQHGTRVPALMNHLGLPPSPDGVADAVAYHEAHHVGDYSSDRAFGQAYVEEREAELPAWARGYVDAERLADDLLTNDFFSLDLCDGAGVAVYGNA